MKRHHIARVLGITLALSTLGGALVWFTARREPPLSRTPEHHAFSGAMFDAVWTQYNTQGDVAMQWHSPTLQSDPTQSLDANNPTSLVEAGHQTWLIQAAHANVEPQRNVTTYQGHVTIANPHQWHATTERMDLHQHTQQITTPNITIHHGPNELNAHGLVWHVQNNSVLLKPPIHGVFNLNDGQHKKACARLDPHAKVGGAPPDHTNTASSHQA